MNQKYHVFFRRVSTAGQDLTMQVSADKPYREKLLSEEIITIDEDAISANKLHIQDRPEMQKLIQFIKADKVDTLYAFDRTRLFRDSYEANEFIDLIQRHNVKMVFTSEGNGHIQATDNYFLESILNIFSDIEGKNIARRTSEARRRYPPRKLGYIKIKETKQYKKDPEKQEALEQFFSSILVVKSVKELIELFVNFRKTLKRSLPDEKLIEMARDPFYAGYDLNKGENKLTHVEAYIDLDTFRQIQQQVGPIFDSLLKRIDELRGQDAYTPICGQCRKPLHYRMDELNNTGFYSCSKRHSKILISNSELANVVQLVLQQIINHLETKELLKHSLSRFRDIRKEIEKEILIIDKQLEEIMEAIVFDMDDRSVEDWRENAQYAKMSKLKNEKTALLNELSKKEQMLTENKSIVKGIENYLGNQSEVNPSFLYSMFI